MRLHSITIMDTTIARLSSEDARDLVMWASQAFGVWTWCTPIPGGHRYTCGPERGHHLYKFATPLLQHSAET